MTGGARSITNIVAAITLLFSQRGTKRWLQAQGCFFWLRGAVDGPRVVRWHRHLRGATHGFALFDLGLNRAYVSPDCGSPGWEFDLSPQEAGQKLHHHETTGAQTSQRINNQQQHQSNQTTIFLSLRQILISPRAPRWHSPAQDGPQCFSL